MSTPSVALFRTVCRFLHGADSERQSLSSEPESDRNQMLDISKILIYVFTTEATSLVYYVHLCLVYFEIT